MCQIIAITLIIQLILMKKSKLRIILKMFIVQQFNKWDKTEMKINKNRKKKKLFQMVLQKNMKKLLFLFKINIELKKLKNDMFFFYIIYIYRYIIIILLLIKLICFFLKFLYIYFFNSNLLNTISCQVFTFYISCIYYF